MSNCSTQKGFALFTVVWVVAIVSVISLVTVNAYLSNTRAAQLEVQRIRANMLLDSGVRFAALSLASPRANVAAGAVPSSALKYRHRHQQVEIEINNEAAYVDLLTGDRDLIMSLLQANGVASPSKVLQSISAMANSQRASSYRSLRETLAGTPGVYQAIIDDATLHNGQNGVHPSLASEGVLSLLGDLSNGQRDRLLKQRSKNTPSLFSTPIESKFFSPSVSAYYRVRTRVVIDGQTYSKAQIIKMINQTGRLFETVAIL